MELLEYGSIRASRLVQEETLDLALVNMNFYEIDKLNSYEMLSDQIVFCVSPEHPLASYKEATMEMLKDEPLIRLGSEYNPAGALRQPSDQTKGTFKCQPALHNT